MKQKHDTIEISSAKVEGISIQATWRSKRKVESKKKSKQDKIVEGNADPYVKYPPRKRRTKPEDTPAKPKKATPNPKKSSTK